MKTILFAAILAWGFLSAVPLAGIDSVEIYSDFNPREYGRSPRKADVKKISFEEFGVARTIAASDPDGILTAVVLDSRVVESLGNFLEGYHERRLGGAWYWMEEAAGRKIFHYYDDAAGLRFSFSAEKPGREITSVITGFYAGDPETRDIVLDHYRKNYVLRIHSAENINNPWINSITFEEALVAATLAGDRAQPLWGMRDGAGLLQDIPGLVAVKMALPLYHYRPIEKNEGEYMSFIRRINNMSGDFARNLHTTVIAEFGMESSQGFQLPEEYVARRAGSGTDAAFLYYDVLVRMGFHARAVAVARGSESPEPVVLFRHGERGNWGALSRTGFYPEVAADWTRVPALILDGKAWYQEIDVSGLFRERRLEYSADAWRPSEP